MRASEIAPRPARVGAEVAGDALAPDHAPPRPTMRPRACPRCGGDAWFDALDDREWRCLQCARPVPVPPERRRAE